VHAVVVALIGGGVTVALARVARRSAVASRLAIEPRRRPVVPRFVRSRLACALDDAALAMSPDDALALWGLASVIAAMVGLGLSAAVGVVAALGVAIGLPVLLRSTGSRRARLVAAAVPDALEQVGAELRAGGTVSTALAAIARGDGPLAVDTTRAQTRVGLGASLDDALHAWTRERPVFGVDAAAGALALSTSVGGRAADALDGLAASLRERLAVAAEARALSAQARYSAWVIGLLPLGWFAVTTVTDPRTLRPLIATDAGRVCAAVGVALELLGALWMRTILRGGGEW
jgi:tight adherence protein B